MQSVAALKMANRLTVLALVGLTFPAACGGSEAGGRPGGEHIPISDQPLAGVIGGQPWTVSGAESNAFLSDTDGLFVTMYPGALSPCQAFPASTEVSKVLVTLPRRVGSYELGYDLIATLYDVNSNTNWGSTRGRIVVETVTATTIAGGAHIIYNANNTVDGQFQVSVCP